MNFQCNQCGACCSKDINFNLSEIFNFQENFIFALKHNFFAVKDISFVEKNLQEHLSKIGFVWQLPEKRTYIYSYIQIVALKIENFCDKLVNKKCSIYFNKPQSCSLSPIDLIQPEKNFQEYFNNNWVTKINSKEYFCDIENGEFIFDDDTEQFSEKISDIYYDNLIYLKDLNTDYKNLFLDNDEVLKKYVLNLYEKTQKTFTKKGYYYSNFIDLLIEYYKKDFLNHGQILYFIEAQIKQLQKINLKGAEFYDEKKYANELLTYLNLINLDNLDNQTSFIKI